MNDPAKDLIPRSSIEYYLRKETVSTNPDAYEAHEKFIAYMDDPEISQFGRWMCSNGINTALVAIEVDLGKIPSIQPEQKIGKWIKMSDADGVYYCCSECGEDLHREWSFDRNYDLFPRKKTIDKTKYCPNCGAKMEEQDG